MSANLPNNTPEISLVAPVFRGGATLPAFIERVREVLLAVQREFEIILVDDGCPSDSWTYIEATCRTDSRIKGVRLSRNYGQQTAVSVGLRYAQGQQIVVIDSDLQNPVEAIPAIIARLDEGAHVVYTTSSVRNHRLDEVTSAMFWLVVNRVLRLALVPNQLMMKGFSRTFLDAFNSYQERVRVVAGIVMDIGFESAIIEVPNRRRSQDRGNYSFLKRLSLSVDFILILSTRPLAALMYVSAGMSFLSVLLLMRAAISYLLNPDVPSGYTTLVSLVTFFGTTTLFAIALLGRYLANIYAEVRQRPMFHVLDEIGFEDE